MPSDFDIAIAWDWEYDREFVSLLKNTANARGLSTLDVSPLNVQEALSDIQRGACSVTVFLDRASDTDQRFLPLAQAVRLTSARIVNLPEAVRHAADKATMHLEFLTHGIEVPYTLIISPYAERQNIELSLDDLARLGRPFIIKPANTTGGGTGVILGAETLRDVIESRQHHKNDKYLLQEKIEPIHLGEEVGWFRIFWSFGSITPCWWHPDSHIYRIVEHDSFGGHSLAPLVTITRSIQDVCQLDFFSTEIALTKQGKFVVVDYVNEICDMRLQSLHQDGVPDQVVMKICDSFAEFVKSYGTQAVRGVDSNST